MLLESYWVNRAFAKIAFIYLAIGAFQIASGSDRLPVVSTSQSSNYINFYADLAIDGSTDGLFNNRSTTATQRESEAWWGADLGSIGIIDEIRLWNRTDAFSARLSEFYVLISEQPFVSSDLATTISDPPLQ